MTPTAYDVTVTREDNLWVADIAGLTAAADVESFGDLEAEVRDLIAGLADTDPDDFAINWRYEVNGRDVTAQFQRFLAIEAELRELRERRDAERLALLQRLAEAGLSQRGGRDRRIPPLGDDQGTGVVEQAGPQLAARCASPQASESTISRGYGGGNTDHGTIGAYPAHQTAAAQRKINLPIHH